MPNGLKRLTTFLAISVLALSVAACTRRLSTPPPPEEEGEISSAQATLEAMRAAIMTQQAAEEQATSTPTPTLELPTATATATVPPTPTPLEPTPTPRGNAGEPVEYTVQEGDWVYSIARKFGVDPEQLIAVNNLQPPYELQVGQVLIIPTNSGTALGPTNTPLSGGRQYTVQPGEYVWSIARKFGVDPWAIIEANNLQFPYTIYPGDVLTIP
jgi:LysM repeat protein